MKKSKILLLVVTIILICSSIMVLSACSLFKNDDDNNHTHTYATEWSYDDEYHWHQANCGHSDLYTDKAEHSFNGSKCSICDFDADASKTYKTITFDVNGGDNEIGSMRFAVGESMSNLPVPSRDGYNFVCWVDKYDRYTEYDFSSIMPNEDLTLLAKWEIKLAGYKDDYVSFKPATSGYKNYTIYDMYRSEVDKFVYVEITSDNLNGRVGQDNNFNLRSMEGMEYRVNQGYTWAWYQGSFDRPNGAQRFTLNYGSNIQFITISDTYGVVQCTYLLDIYVRHDYYMNLYTSIYDEEPYTKVRVIENDRFSADTETKDIGFEFDSRVYFNDKNGKYEKFVYSTPITKSWNLYQTYKDIEISADLNGGTLNDKLIVKPYSKYFTLPSAEKEGCDFLGWQMPNGKYLTNVQGYSGENCISTTINPKTLKAIFAEKQYYFDFDGKKLATKKTVPVVTYTDSTMTEILEIVYTPYEYDCSVPTITPNTNNFVFKGWQQYYLNSNNEFSESLSTFDFNTKITKPIALIPDMEYNATPTIPVGTKVTFGSRNTYKMYLPVAERYVLKITTTGTVKFTINSYGNTSAKDYTATSSSPQSINLDYYVYELGANKHAKGYVTFTVNSLSGEFTAELVGKTGKSSENSAITNQDNLRKVGDEYEVSLVKNGYTFDGWYNGGEKYSDTKSLQMVKEELTLTPNWIKCQTTLDKSISVAGNVKGVEGTTFAGENTTITAETNNGYTWVGWFDGDTLLTNELSYTYVQTTLPKTFTAKWIKVSTQSSSTTAGTVSSLTGKYNVGDSVTITATTKAGYTFVGWFNGDIKVTSDLSYTFAMPNESMTYTAKWVKVSLSRNNSSAGSVSSLTGTYKVGENVTITATTNSGYTWVGWFNGENRLTDQLSYTFTMTSENVTYEARWAKVTLSKNNYSAGSVSSLTGKYKVGDNATITATTNSGYTWVGWFNGENKLTDQLSYTFTMTSENVTYEARWTYYTLTTKVNDTNAGSVTVKNNTKVTAGEKVAITATTKAGYTFLGWFNGEEKLSSESNYTFNMPAENVIYTAKWAAFTLTTKADDSNAGYVTAKNAVKITAGEEVTITATTYSSYTFVGWFNGDTLLSENFKYTFNMPAESVTYTAKWTIYTLTTAKNNNDAGTITAKNAVKISAGTDVTITATTKSGYTFVGWFKGEEVLSNQLSYTFAMPRESVIYEARWIKVSLTRSNTSAGTISSLTDKYKAGDEATITATTNSGYTWVGWFNGEEKLTSELSYTFNMPSENVTYTAKWIKVTLSRNNISAGSLSSLTGKYKVGDEVTVTAKTYSGYTWLGWFNGDIKLTDELSYTFAMPSENVTYEARWTYYTLTTASNDNNAGTVTEKNAVKTTAGKEVTITATTNNGYTFLGWFDGEEELSRDLSYTFAMPHKKVTYTAKWIACPISVTTNGDGGTVSSPPSTSIFGQSYTITATTNSGYTFIGWFNGEEKLSNELSYTFEMPSENVTFTAKWIKVIIEKNINNAGTTTSLSDRYTVGDKVSVVATSNSGYTWLGWYNGDELLTTDFELNFVMSDHVVTYTAKWIICPITVALSDTNAGVVNGLDGNVINSNVTLTAQTNIGYTWVGWFNGDTMLTDSLTYLVTIAEEKVDLIAKWSKTSIVKSIPNAGETTPLDSTYKVGDNVSVTASTNAGYTWIGWFDGDNLLTSDMEFSFEMTAENVAYTAKWIKINIVVNNISAGSVTQLTGTYKVGDNVTVNATSNSGYIWIGWFDGETLLTRSQTYSFNMPEESATYTATWIKITLNKNINNGGTISGLEDDNLVYGDNVTVTATTNLGYNWLGWFDGNEKVSSTNRYDFTIGNKELTLTAKWQVKPEMAMFTFTSTESTCAISGALSPSTLTEVKIPSYVTSISVREFTTCHYIETITVEAGNARYRAENNCLIDKDYEKLVLGCKNSIIPTSSDVTILGNASFCGRYGLTTILIPENITSIESPDSSAGQFANCKDLTSVEWQVDLKLGLLPNYVYNMFRGCTKLSEFKMTGSNSLFYTKNNCLLYRQQAWAKENNKLILACNPTSIPAEASIISSNAFALCSEMTSLVIPNTITSIEQGALYGMSSLKEITIPFVGRDADRFNATDYDRISGPYLFGYIFGSVSYNGSIAVRQYGVNEDSNYLRTYYFPQSLTKVTLTNGDACDNAFNNWTNLQQLVGATSLGTRALFNCTGITSIDLSKCTSIGTLALSQTNITTITIPDDAGTSAFANCKYLKTVIYKGNYIQNRVFEGCTSLQSITLPSTLIRIGEYAFKDCTSLQNVTLPSSLTAINDGAFYGCTSFTSITIPAKVTFVGALAFAECSNLKTVTFKDTKGWVRARYRTVPSTEYRDITVDNATENAIRLNDISHGNNGYWYNDGWGRCFWIKQ